MHRLHLLMRGAALAAGVAAVPAAAQTTPPAPVGRVCPDPAEPCPGFRPHDLSFVLPADGVARAEARSDSVYVVILRSGARCTIGEAERTAAQARFPAAKVFAERFGCEDDVENNVTYTNVNTAVSFLAVHAGADLAEARRTLDAARRAGAFPGANLRRLQVVYVYP